MALTLEIVSGMFGPGEIRLTDHGQVLARRSMCELMADDAVRLAWETARDAMRWHDEAVALERAAAMPGALPLSPHRVPAEQHFMEAVRALFPAVRALFPEYPAQPDPPQQDSAVPGSA